MSRPYTLAAALTNRSKKPVTRSKSTTSNRSESGESPYDKLLEKYKSSEIEIYNLKQENKVAREDLKILQVENIQLHNENCLLRNENEELKTKNEQLKYDNEHFIKKREDKESEITMLHEKLEETNSLKKGKFSSMVGKLQLKLIRRPTRDTLLKNGYYKNEPCFGNDLENSIMHDVYIDVPKVIVESVKVLESNESHLRSMGLYRISGSHTVIQKLRYKINSNNYKLLWEQTDPNNITGLIKLFFREMRKPMISLDHIKETIPKEQYTHFADTDKDNHDKIVKMRTLIGKLSPKYRSTLKYFIGHLKRVADTPGNDMTPYTLSIVIGACICYETMADVCFDPELCRIPNKCIEIMIQNCKDIF